MNRVDADGKHYIDWLHKLVVPNPLYMPINVAFEKLVSIRKGVENNIRKNENYNFVSKWYWLANYFDAKIYWWNINNPDKKIEKFNFMGMNIENIGQTIKKQIESTIT